MLQYTTIEICSSVLFIKSQCITSYVNNSGKVVLIISICRLRINWGFKNGRIFNVSRQAVSGWVGVSLAGNVAQDTQLKRKRDMQDWSYLILWKIKFLLISLKIIYWRICLKIFRFREVHGIYALFVAAITSPLEKKYEFNWR